MPVLESIKKTKRITLPSYEGSEVDIYTDVFFEDVIGFEKLSDPSTKEVLGFLPQMIKGWNFTDTQGVQMEVTAKNIGLLKMADVNFLLSEVVAVLNDVKKNSEGED